MTRQVSKLVLAVCFLEVAQASLSVRLFSTQTVPQLRIGGKTLRAEELTQKRAFAAPVRMEVNGRSIESRYPVTVQRSGAGLTVTLDMPPEEYVKTVLAGEVGSMQRVEVLKAMAIAARTYAFRFPTRHKAQGFNFCDTTHCQDIRLTWENALVDQAVESTDREILWFQGRPASAYYSQNCGGHSEAAGKVWLDQSMPYLVGRPDPYCPSKTWRAEVRKEDLAKLLGRTVATLQVLTRSESGRALELDLGGGSRMRAAAFRFLLGRTAGWAMVRSDMYRTQDTGVAIVFEGRGGGHGVGMCQQGAEEMAGRGLGYRDILKHYFPGTTVGINAQGIDWKYLSGERTRLATTNPGADQALLATADALVRELEGRVGVRFPAPPLLRVYPTVAVFRDATGEPGWVAASTRGNTVRLQPQARDRALLRHELLHLLLESARADLPRWYREGLVQWLTKARVAESATAPSDARFAAAPRQAYAQAQGFVQRLIRLRGEAEVINWALRGIPAELQAARPGTAMPSPQTPQPGSSGSPN